MKVSTRRIAASSATLLVESVVRVGVTAAISFWIARALGPAQFGIINFASALMGIFLAVGTLGLEVPSVLRLTRDERPGRMLGTLLALRAGAAVLAFVLTAALALLLKHDDPQTLAVTLVVALSILGYAPSVFDYWFKARVEAGPPALARMLATLIAATAKVVVLQMGWGLVALAWTVVIEAAVMSLLLYLAWRHASRQSAADPLRLDRALALPLVRESLPYLGSALVVLVYMKADVVLLGHLSTQEQTGLYSLVQKLSEVLYIVPVAIIDSAYPALARRAGVQGRDPAQQGQLLFDVAVAASLLAAICGVLLAQPLISLVFGQGYAPAVQMFQLHAWTCVALALGLARHRWLATMGLQRYVLWTALFGAVINVALNVAMIPRWGAWGAAAAAVAAHFASGLLASFAFGALRQTGAMQLSALWPWRRLFRLALERRNAT